MESMSDKLYGLVTDAKEHLVEIVLVVFAVVALVCYVYPGDVLVIKM